MKKIFRPASILVISIVLALISAAFSNSNSTQPVSLSKYSNASFYLQATATPKLAQDHSEVGSTDGITLLSFVIVAIIVIPILLKRKSWSQF